MRVLFVLLGLLWTSLVSAQTLEDYLFLEFDADGKATVVVDGANLQIRNGTGSTERVNGLGNLIIGENVQRRGQRGWSQECSHSLLIGDRHACFDYGHVLIGEQHLGRGAFASALNGYANWAQAPYSVIVSGDGNTTRGEMAVTLTGHHNINLQKLAIIGTGERNYTLPGTNPDGTPWWGGAIVTGNHNAVWDVGTAVLTGRNVYCSTPYESCEYP
jgi:hypothetical protein